MSEYIETVFLVFKKVNIKATVQNDKKMKFEQAKQEKIDK